MHYLAVVASENAKKNGPRAAIPSPSARASSTSRAFRGLSVSAQTVGPMGDDERASEIVLKLLQSNTILEAFGNAETVPSWSTLIGTL